MTGELTRIALAVFGLSVAISSVSLIPAEIAASNMVTKDVPLARTILGQNAQMISCIDRLRDRDREEIVQHGIVPAKTCLAIADGILAHSPTRSSAHIVRAISLHRMGDYARAAEALESSSVVGRNEGWLAVVRVRTALEIADVGEALDIRERMETAASADLRVVTGSKRLGARLAFLFHEAGARQDWFVDEIETHPIEVQGEFLLAVRRLRSTGGAE